MDSCAYLQVAWSLCAHAGYLTLKEVFSYGALMAVVNLLLWGVVGGAWWKFLGFL